MQDTVAVEDTGGVRRVTLHRPPVNALTLVEYDALATAFEVPSATRVVLLRARGRVWSAGQDLGELREQVDDHARSAYLRRATRGVAAAARCPVPVLTALDGPAVGAGALLVACSDIVLGTPAASLAFPELRVGLRLGRSLLADLLPAAVVAHAFATGAPIAAERLHRLGVLAELVAPDELDERVEALLAELVAIPDAGLRWLRRLPRREELAADYLDEVARL
ncbi:enoyl-CoA hydratase/isomerase family protein [Nocardioides sp.]|uniref:enoyl-CoA hydratase/isomerase family protein n=1 Tax=Nocardioides sp. TaxID=35761 RepID=UPI0025FAAD15|nr:enoyl-CoA hydratase/isomerase family protein [Nocardioides sp.]